MEIKTYTRVNGSDCGGLKKALLLCCACCGCSVSLPLPLYLPPSVCLSTPPSHSPPLSFPLCIMSLPLIPSPFFSSLYHVPPSPSPLSLSLPPSLSHISLSVFPPPLSLPSGCLSVQVSVALPYFTFLGVT